MNRRLTLSLFWLLLLSPALQASPIWIEGEDATKNGMRKHGWYDSVKRDALSGGDWLSHFDKNRQGEASFRFEVLESDTYTFWLRANPVKSSMSYKLDGGNWILVDWEADLRGRNNIAADNKPDLRFIAWCRIGKIPLKAGAHTISFRTDSALQNHGGIDCFTFVRIPFAPAGIKKPTVRSGAAGPDDWFPVVFDTDPLSKDSIIDMSRLVPAPAGKLGFLKRSGSSLKFERAGAPTKFWAVGGNLGNKKSGELTQAARWLRKHGINMIRQHTVIGAVGFLDARGQFDAEKLDRYDRWFAALKEQGVYTTWSIIYPHHGKFLRKQDGYNPKRFEALREGTQEPITVNDYINLDRDLQDIALRYFKALLEHRNPHTGLAYKDDPALAVLEFQNESNVFFHTLNGLARGKPALFAGDLQKRFFTFILAKYRTRDAVAKAWGNRWQPADNWDAGQLALMGAYHWGSDGPVYEYKGQTRRAGDYIEFMTSLQRGYYARRQKEVRALGFRGVTVTTAWKSGGPAASMANLYCDTAADMIDRHNYFGGGAGQYVIQEGKVNNATHLSQPGHGLLSLGLFQVFNRPFAVSEWSMTPPAPWKLEAAPLVAFYGMGLQDWDVSLHFSCGAVRMGNGWPNQSKFVSQTPHYMGQFPALAMAVHRNHIKRGDIMALRALSEKEIFAGVDVLGQALSGGGHDDKRLEGKLSTPPELLAIGRVLVSFDKMQPQKRDPSRYWDRDKKVLRSTTEELVWHYEDRYVEVRSPKTQALIGFAPSGIVSLPDVAVKLSTPFVSLIFTPLDDQELAKSKHILITAMARDKQTGAQYNGDQTQLIKMGSPPLLMEPVQAAIKLAGAAPKEVKVLDVYGVPTGGTVKTSQNGAFKIDGTYETYYYYVNR
jgi:hypothetical protein